MEEGKSDLSMQRGGRWRRFLPKKGEKLSILFHGGTDINKFWAKALDRPINLLGQKMIQNGGPKEAQTIEGLASTHITSISESDVILVYQWGEK